VTRDERKNQMELKNRMALLDDDALRATIAVADEILAARHRVQVDPGLPPSCLTLRMLLLAILDRLERLSWSVADFERGRANAAGSLRRHIRLARMFTGWALERPARP
jgi:hypothetical protein